MTCIVAVKSKDGVVIGGDSAAVSESYSTARADTKVFNSGPMVMGFTSSFRMGQILMTSFSPPEHDPRIEDYKFMCVDFVDAVMKTFDKKGWGHKSDNVQTGGHFLVGYKGEIYQIQSDFQVGKPIELYSAVGCGEEFALGSLWNSFGETDTLPTRAAAEKAITNALDAACKFSGWVKPPYTFVVEDKDKNLWGEK